LFFEKKKKLPLKRVLKDILIFHTGTVFFCSIYHVVAENLAKPLAILTTSLKDAYNTSNIAKFVYILLSPLVGVYYLFLRFASKKSYIHTIMWSDGYVSASHKQYFLSFRHKDRMKDLDFVQDFIILQLKVNSFFKRNLILILFFYFFKKLINRFALLL